ncbi:MAG: 23S rRNA (uracil(1939)-C(5))-methyltransferase RlmD [Elusimicrobia bacterium]|nr:23S rRNA (uracil(1939)-C(5))-methyltransferase RlmD [Candidatus Liberimonas magnetica]
MEIVIEKIVYPGNALGRGSDGIATFVEGALVGEVVEVEVFKNKKTFKEARLLNIIKPSPLRIIAKCPSYGVCGGCSFQHVGYEDQVKIKEENVKELIQLFNVPMEPIIKSPEQWGYRNKMEFSYANDKNGLLLGLHKKKQFNQYCSVPPCFIADPDMMKVVKQAVDFSVNSDQISYDKRTHEGVYRHFVIRKAKHTGQILVNIVTNKVSGIDESFFSKLIEELKDKVTSIYWTINSSVSDAVKADKLILLQGKKAIEEKLVVNNKEYSFLISPFSFFQTNTFGTEKLYQTVFELMECKVTDSVLDLYCGTGTIGLVLAPYVKNVYGIDSNEAAILDASLNSKNNGIKNIDFKPVIVEKWVKENAMPFFNALVVDPPRNGLSGKVLDFIIDKKPEKIVYVSCNPSTLARDLNDLTKKSCYKIKRIVPLDMFPQTFHIETVVSLEIDKNQIKV